MNIRHLRLFAGLAAVIALAGCGDVTPGEATGAKVLGNLLEKAGVKGEVASFKKTSGRYIARGEVEAYELLYQADIKFPNGLDEKCVDPHERGKCAFLGLDEDRKFAKSDSLITSEGALHFIKTEKGWVGEDNNAY